MKIPAEEWVGDYPRTIESCETVWGLTQNGESILFDEAFDWVKPKNLTTPEHIERYLNHLNERVESFVADDGYIYITVQWRSGDMVYDPMYLKFKYADLSEGEPFFIQAQDKWNNTHISVNSIGMDSWKVTKDRQRKRVKDVEQSEDLTLLMDKLMQGLTLTPQEFAKLKGGVRNNSLEYYSAYVAKWIGDRKPRWAINLSKYYRQPKHRAGLMIFQPQKNKVQQKVKVNLLNWDFLLV